MLSHNQKPPSLALMGVLSFIAMYSLMYLMVDTFANVLPNLNQFYMAGLMTAPMVVIELTLMGSMYPRKTKNFLIGISLFAALVFIFLIRKQVAITDRQFLQSMIPHHGAAILMCQRAPIQDPEIKRLCEQIIAGQQAEIDFMQRKLVELGR